MIYMLIRRIVRIKGKKGLLYWLIFGWWLEPLLALLLLMAYFFK